MTFGLSPKSTELILQALDQWKEIEKAHIFGSRAIGNYKRGSDVDLVLYGSEITADILLQVGALLNEDLPLPYHFDLVHYETTDNAELKRHIDKKSQVFYVRNSIQPDTVEDW